MQSLNITENTSALQTQLCAAHQLTAQLSSEQASIYGQMMAYVSDLKRALTERNQAIGKANESMLSKSRFLARVNHEFRTPLTTIVGFSTMLLKGVPLDHSTALNKINDAAQKLLNMVQDLISLSDQPANTAPTKIEASALCEGLERLLASYRERATEKDLKVHFEATCDADSSVLIELEMLTRLLQPLLDNALKFTATGEVTLSLMLHKNAPSWIEVADTGIGIPEKHNVHLFAPLEQGDGSATRAHGGLGLGLPLARSLADLIGCTMSIDSVVDAGTRVRVTLPETGAMISPATSRHSPLTSDILLQRQEILTLSHSLGVSQKETQQARIDALLRLSAAAELKDNDTGVHIERMSHYSALLAQEMGQATSYCDTLLYASRMHDVGKIGIPDRILQKPGALDGDEWFVMRQHPEIGAQLLKGAGNNLYDMASEVALFHHEKFDGTGYPNNCSGQNIPLSGRIVALADFFDALTMDRCYRPAMSDDTALNMVMEQRGVHFDPEVVDAFFRIKGRIIATRNKINQGGQIYQ
jgi:putative two-component system response regulator